MRNNEDIQVLASDVNRKNETVKSKLKLRAAWVVVSIFLLACLGGLIWLFVEEPLFMSALFAIFAVPSALLWATSIIIEDSNYYCGD